MTAAVNSNGAEITSEELVSRARAWIGTPYCHQASCRGAGTDCLGLLLGIWREVRGQEPEPIPPYTPDWSEPARTEDLLEAAIRHMRALDFSDREPGDVLILRMRRDGVAKHIGILAHPKAGYESIIHAYSGHGVVESALTPAWSEKVAGVFRFPFRSI